MAITTMDQLIAGLELGSRINILKASMTAEGAGTFQSLLKATGNPPGAIANPPTLTGECPTKATTYSLNFSDVTIGNKKYIGRVNMQGSTAGSLIIYDRLWHNSGLVGNVTTDQVVNSIPLTRYTDGRNIEIFGEIYTAIGATAATLTVNYTDMNNAAVVGTYTHPANAESVGQMFLINPPAGAKGCKSIQSAKFSVTTGTAGNWGLVMVRRLCEVPLSLINVATVMDAFDTGMPEIQNDACICLMQMCTTTNTGNILGAIDILEG